MMATGDAMCEALIFDIGNVLLRFDFQRTLSRIASDCAVDDPSQILGMLEPLKMRFETGALSSEVFLEEAARRLGYAGSKGALAQAWQEIFDPIDQMHRLVERLRGRIPLYLLSNTNELHAAYFLSRWTVFAHFEGAVYSHEVGLMKPDSDIYRAAVRQFGVVAERTLFIDDLAVNVEAARAVGLQAHQYAEQEHGTLLEVLRRAGLGAFLTGG